MGVVPRTDLVDKGLLMKHERRFQLKVSERRTLLKLGDALVIIFATFGALWIWALVDGSGPSVGFFVVNSWWFVLLLGLWIVLASANDFYDLQLSSRPSQGLPRLAQIILQLLVAYLIIFFLSPRSELPRLFILYYSLLSFTLILLWRTVVWVLVIRRLGIKRRVLVIGAGWAARTIVRVLTEEMSDDYEVVGLIAEFDPQDTLTNDVPLLGGGKELVQVAEKERVSDLIMAYGTTLPGEIYQGVMDCYERGFSIIPMPLLYEQITGRVPVEHVGPEDWKIILPMIQTSIFNPFSRLKRLMDISLSLVGLLLFVLILPVLALAIRLDSQGPIFYSQERVGKGGKPFRMIKLRSMVVNAEADGPQWASAGDARITRVGAIMRKARLDELPQFINILRGEMSLVGPRAERPYFVEQLSQEIPFYRTRHVVRPGATGWAQVKYNYGNSVEDALMKLQYDLYYIRHQSLALDMLIMLRTIGKMIRLSGQ